MNEFEPSDARLDALVSFGLSLATGKEPEPLFRELCDKARALVGARQAFVGVLDDAGVALRYHFAGGLDPPLAGSVALRQPTAGWLVSVTREGRSIRLVGAEADAERLRLHDQLPAFSALLAVPIQTSSKIFGWLCLADRPGFDEFSPTDEQLARALAGAAAVSYENIRRYEEVQRSAERLGLLREIDRAVLASRSVEEIAATVTQRIRRLIACERVAIILLDSGVTRARIAAQDPPGLPGFETRAAFALGLLEEVSAVAARLRQGEVVRVDLATWSADPVICEMLAKGLRRFVFVPLIAFDDLIGILSFQVGTVDSFNEEELDVASEAGTQLAVAIQQAANRRRIENAEARYHGLFEHVPVGVFRSLRDATITDLNPAGIEMLGLPNANAVKSVNVADVYANPEDFQRLVTLVERDGVVRDFEAVLRRFDGEAIWGSTSIRATRDADGTLIGFDGIWTNVSARKAAEEALRERERMLEELFDASPAGIAILDDDLRYVRVNERMAAINGLPLESHLGLRLRDALPDFAATLEPLLERVMTTGEPLLDTEVSGITPAEPGVVRHWIASYFPITDRGGRRSSLGVIVVEVTELRETERKFRIALTRAEESDRLKSAFLANVSHEVRTPLNVILGYNALIAEGLAEAGDRRFEDDLRAVNRASQRLLQTIQGIMDLSRIESATFDFKPMAVDLVSLVEEGVRQWKGQAERKQLSLRREIEAGNVVVVLDEYCFRQSFDRLLDNAIKFTERGEIIVRIDRDRDGNPLLSIKDSGVGIDAKFLPNLFKPFSQEDIGNTRRFEGPGIGLALVKRYLALNCAELSVTSEKGLGTTCTIRFLGSKTIAPPIATTPETGSVDAVKSGQGGRPLVLVVEDDELTQKLIATILGRDYEILVAATGAEARAHLSEPSNDVSLVLMDLSLKGSEDGLTITRWLRETARWRELPVIATTAHAQPEDRQRALEAGCSAFLAKPISRQELQAAIRRFVAAP